MIKDILNPSNTLSLSRAPLALFFFIENIYIRILVITIAMITDFLDGYIARKYNYKTKFGTILDPTMDKFFVYFVLSILILECKITFLKIIAMISRDIFLCFFLIYLYLSKKLKNYQFRSVKWGKITTAFQFCVIIILSLKFNIPSLFYLLFIIFGSLAFIELFQFLEAKKEKQYN